jgi:hypothetical protein
MNWGKSIVITLVVFVVFITGMSVYMFGTPQDDYDHDYYEKGLDFDKDYAKEENVVKYHAQPMIQLENEAVTIAFHTVATGTIKFERPSNTGMDKLFKISASSFTLPDSELAKGEWQLTLTWESNGHDYLYHQKILIQ